LLHLLKEERNARIHLTATIFVIFAGIYFHLTNAEWVMLTFAFGIVWISEAINTVIENTLDFISEKHDPKIGKIKDIAAGAVLLSAAVALVIGGLIFIPKWV